MSKIKSMVTNILNFVSDIFYPSTCCICGEVTKSFTDPENVSVKLGKNVFSSPYCRSCTARLEKSYGPWIRKTNTKNIRAYFLFDYSDETVKHAVRHIKACECQRCRIFFANAAKECLDRLTADGSELTYIPRSRKLYAKYGFDQSACILQEYTKLAKHRNFIEIFDRGAGIFNNAPQKSLNYKQRFENARSSLSLKPDCRLPLSVVVFDDIITTGATADTAAMLLYSKKVNSVKLFFLAEAPLIK